MDTLIQCFACTPVAHDHDPRRSVRILCPDHLGATQTISGVSLPAVIDKINGELSGGWLEGAPLQWLFGSVTIDGDDGLQRQGWSLYIPAIFAVAEDRFGASSWLEYWITDLSLEAADFRQPALDDLARSMPEGPISAHSLVAWAERVAGSEGQAAVQQAWMVWAGETLAAERRAATGRCWPVGDEVFDWVNPPWEPLQGDAAAAFVGAFTHALRRRSGLLSTPRNRADAT